MSKCQKLPNPLSDKKVPQRGHHQISPLQLHLQYASSSENPLPILGLLPVMIEWRGKPIPCSEKKSWKMFIYSFDVALTCFSTSSHIADNQHDVKKEDSATQKSLSHWYMFLHSDRSWLVRKAQMGSAIQLLAASPIIMKQDGITNRQNQ